MSPLVRAGLWAILAALAPSCAPLSQPRAAAPTQPGSDALAQEEASALQRHRLRRNQLGSQPEAFHRPWIAALPFVDDSGFREGVWDIPNEMPRMLSSEMERSSAWNVVPYDAVAEVVAKAPQQWLDEDLQRVGEALGADLLVTGALLDYNMERLHVGDPLIGGYKSFKGTAEIELQVVRAADLTRAGSAHAEQEVVDRGLGLDLLGKPREQDYQFANLGRMVFGGEEFRATAIGQATAAAMEELVRELAEIVRPQGIAVASGTPEILSVFGEEIFINVGSENGVHRGYRFTVRPGRQRSSGPDPAAPIGVVEVQDVIGARVSKVIALSGGGQIAVGDRLDLLVAEPE